MGWTTTDSFHLACLAWQSFAFRCTNAFLHVSTMPLNSCMVPTQKLPDLAEHLCLTGAAHMHLKDSSGLCYRRDRWQKQHEREQSFEEVSPGNPVVASSQKQQAWAVQRLPICGPLAVSAYRWPGPWPRAQSWQIFLSWSLELDFKSRDSELVQRQSDSLVPLKSTMQSAPGTGTLLWPRTKHTSPRPLALGISQSA